MSASSLLNRAAYALTANKQHLILNVVEEFKNILRHDPVHNAPLFGPLLTSADRLGAFPSEHDSACQITDFALTHFPYNNSSETQVADFLQESGAILFENIEAIAVFDRAKAIKLLQESEKQLPQNLKFFSNSMNAHKERLADKWAQHVMALANDDDQQALAFKIALEVKDSMPCTSRISVRAEDVLTNIEQTYVPSAQETQAFVENFSARRPQNATPNGGASPFFKILSRD